MLKWTNGIDDGCILDITCNTLIIERMRKTLFSDRLDFTSHALNFIVHFFLSLCLYVFFLFFVFFLVASSVLFFTLYQHA